MSQYDNDELLRKYNWEFLRRNSNYRRDYDELNNLFFKMLKKFDGSSFSNNALKASDELRNEYFSSIESGVDNIINSMYVFSLCLMMVQFIETYRYTKTLREKSNELFPFVNNDKKLPGWAVDDHFKRTGVDLQEVIDNFEQDHKIRQNFYLSAEFVAWKDSVVNIIKKYGTFYDYRVTFDNYYEIAKNWSADEDFMKKNENSIHGFPQFLGYGNFAEDVILPKRWSFDFGPLNSERVVFRDMNGFDYGIGNKYNNKFEGMKKIRVDINLEASKTALMNEFSKFLNYFHGYTESCQRNDFSVYQTALDIYDLKSANKSYEQIISQVFKTTKDDESYESYRKRATRGYKKAKEMIEKWDI